MKMLSKYWNYVSNLQWLETLVFQHPELELMMKTYITLIAFISVNTTIFHHPTSEAYLSDRIPVLCLKESVKSKCPGASRHPSENFKIPTTDGGTV